MAKRRAGTILRILVAVLALLAIVLGALWLFGPREPATYAIRFDPAVIGPDPDAYLARTEADVPNLRPEAAKEIVWAYPASHARTPLAIVFIHGFSASKGELRPLPDLVAKALGANLFYTRLAGHGRDGAAMPQANVDDWMNDVAEALAIGHRLGERVVVMGNSTGSTLAILAASDPTLSREIAGLVLLAPNLRVNNRWSFVLDLPFARDFAPWLFGEERGEASADPRVNAVWTAPYPSVAVLPMGAAVRAARTSDIAAIKIPALFLFSPNDKVVDPEATRRVIERWTAPKEAVEVTDSQTADQHILAGDLLSPNTTQPLATRIAAWIAALPKS
ncbi:lysophospholipase [Aureimonas endophytica]|uniref:Lysophospholipase n=1 Tax=Aureimonas endophytica TaxID=2027858 RepID=A0A916ZEE2_9HYPH|nr:alpha/beta fold hydrolase [Aureimonas endophytica]GGD91485.1 lysophospholipase [Aureimonas endophytica]